MGKHFEQTELTRQSIIGAFWMIASEDDRARITVSAVTERAGVNRSTFYEYFSDIEGLTNLIEDELIDELKSLLGGLYIKYNLNCSYRDLAKALAPYYDRITILLMRDADRHFLFRVQKEAVELLAGITKNHDPMIEYEIAFVVAAFTGLLQYWKETGSRIDEDTFTEVFHTLCISGLKAQCTDAEPA